jgi:hypothetical protein
MPKRYEALRDKFVKEGLPYDEAQEKAAKIYNATRKKNEPKLTNKPHKRKK